jgi:hypothetical protein
MVMTAVSARGHAGLADVRAYVTLYSNRRHIVIERLKGRFDDFLVLLTDSLYIGQMSEVEIRVLRYDPQGASRGFVRDESGRFVRPDRTPLLTTVYTIHAETFYRPRRPPSGGKENNDSTPPFPLPSRTPPFAKGGAGGERKIADVLEEVRKKFSSFLPPDRHVLSSNPSGRAGTAG